MKGIMIAVVMLMGAIVACGGAFGGIRCQEDFTADVSCLGNIGSLDGSQTLTASSDRLETGRWEASVLVAVESGTITVSFTDADGNTISEEVSEGGVAEGSANIVDGSFNVTLESVGGPAEGISYTISLDEVDN